MSVKPLLPSLDYTAGVPLANRPKGRVPKDQDMSLPTESMGNRYGVGPLFGKPAYTNGYFLLMGTPAPELINDGFRRNMDQVVPPFVRADDTVTPVGYAVSGGTPVIVFSDAGMINAGIYDHVLKAYPGATFRRAPGELEGPYAIDDANGQTVGAAMPIKPNTMPEALRDLVDRRNLHKIDLAALKQAKQNIEGEGVMLRSYERSVERAEAALKAAKSKTATTKATRELSSAKRQLADYRWKLVFNKEIITKMEAAIAAFNKRGR